MNHPAELAIFEYLGKAVRGETDMAEDIRKQVASDVEAALEKQFSSGPRDKFRLRMSNIGRPTCQLWFEKNASEDKAPLPPHFLINMMIGDIVEAVFKGLLRAAGVDFKDNDNVTLKLKDGTEIKGEYDLVMDGKVDDVKSASDWSYKNKFTNLENLAEMDDFGYVSQLVGYANAADLDVGGWWVVNKANGEFKYVDAGSVDKPTVMQEIEETVEYINEDKPFERCFEAIPEKFNRKLTGNIVLGKTCGFCSFKHKCWPGVQTRNSVKSTAKKPPVVDYVFLSPEYAET